MKWPVQYPLMGGIDRSKVSYKADSSSFWDMVNFRHDIDVRGRLEQTPYFVAANGGSRGTYYLGGSIVEPTNSSVRFLSDDFSMTDYVFWRDRGTTGGQVQAFYQTVVPAGESVTTGCRIVINDVVALGINLGATLDIQIHTDATHFRWRKNGGAFSSDIAITTSGVSIDSGNATVYFLAASGFDFTTPSAWSWQRTDASFSGTSFTSTEPTESLFYNGSIYFTSVDKRIMCAALDTSTGAIAYVISVGYRPVYGSYLAIFDDHLIVGKFAKTYNFSFAPDRQRVVGWSDKTDIFNFIATDVNEADQEALAYSIRFDGFGTYQSKFQVVGLIVRQQQLYVATSYGMYITSDLGLPVVFSFLPNEFPPIWFNDGIRTIPAGDNTYIVSAKSVYVLNAQGASDIGAPISAFLNGTLGQRYGCYDLYRKELIIYDGETQFFYCYQERYQIWYRRAGSFAGIVSSFYVSEELVIYVGTSNLGVLKENPDFDTQPVKDTGTGSSYAVPTLTCQAIGTGLRIVKESTATYLGATVSFADSSFYTSGAALLGSIYYYSLDSGDVTGSPTGVVDTWNSSKTDGHVSGPRVPFRTLALEFQATGTVTKPPGRITITGLELDGINPKGQVER